MASPKINSRRLAELVDGGETDLVEFKREWWNLKSKLGKGHLARDVLAMANAASPTESGLIIIGVEDKKAGGSVVGVAETPSQEIVAQVLDTYTNPLPRIRLDKLPHSGKKLSVLEIIWSEFHPHYATRVVDTILSTDAVYTRRAGTVDRLKPVEIERLIRAKEARLGKITERSPLDVGFVEIPTGGDDRISIRVTNVVEEPITSINASVDVILIHYRNALCRMPLISNLTLAPGESREFDFRTSNATYYDQQQGKALRYEGFVWSRWVDLRLHLRYRSRDGIFCEIVREASLG